MESDNCTPSKVKRIAILGGGTAGFLTALALKKHVPSCEVVVVRSTKLGVIGVGEGTIVSVVAFLHNFLELDPSEFLDKTAASIKLGIKYLWGPRSHFHYTFSSQLSGRNQDIDLARGYFCEREFDYANREAALMAFDKVCSLGTDGQPNLRSSYAYHLENRRFVDYLESLVSLQGVELYDDLVDDVVHDEGGVKQLRLQSGRSIDADFFVDCSGFKGLLIGDTLQEEFVDFRNALFCNSAVIGGWARTEDDPYHPYTTAETMEAGWSWQIEHDAIVNRGYVYSADFISDDQARDEFLRRNPRIENTRLIRFRSGARKRVWVKNVIAIGNSAGFVEPLEATAIGMICDSIVNLVRALNASDGWLGPVQRRIVNETQSENWRIIRDFLAIHYRFNSRLETPFWQMCRHDTPLGQAQEFVDYYQEVGPDFELLRNQLKRDFFGAEGYLAMLVGQAVPYRRQVELTPRHKHRWKLYKNSLKEAAWLAMDMNEFLRMARNGPQPNAAGLAAVDTQQSGIGDLDWH